MIGDHLGMKLLDYPAAQEVLTDIDAAITEFDEKRVQVGVVISFRWALPMIQ
jgi:hypothetical protein